MSWGEALLLSLSSGLFAILAHRLGRAERRLAHTRIDLMHVVSVLMRPELMRNAPAADELRRSFPELAERPIYAPAPDGES